MNLTIKKKYHKEADQTGVFFSFDSEIKEFSNIWIIQQLTGNKSILTWKIYTHVSSKAVTRIQSPLYSLNLNLEIKKNDKKVE